MFEGAIAAFLNRLLGKYVEDLDTEQFNVGIFSGDTCLTDLKLKSEALYQLGLPIRVEVGLIGKIALKIPWASLFSQPIVLCVEDVYIVAVPATCGAYDAEVQKRLIRAEKRKILEDLQEDDAYKSGISPDLMDGLLASVRKNFQITINNVHIRYEETLLNKTLCACGICIQTISVTTTNNKWKPGVSGNNSNTVYQLVRAESLSAYMDPDTESSLSGHPRDWDMSSLLAWKSTMYRALQTFGMRNKEFQFLLKPFSARIKVIVHKGTENQSSRMLIDIVLQDVAMQVTEAQYVAFCQLYDSLLRAVINRPYSKHRPNNPESESTASWWKYACNSVLEHNVRPYTWRNVIEHRKNYRKYKECCMQTLQRPNDMELKLDLQKYEDNLSILNIVIAREHAKQELRNSELERECLSSKATLAKQNAVESMSPRHERTFQNGNLDDKEPVMKKIKLEKLPRPLDYKINFTLGNCCLSLLNTDREVLVMTVTQLLTSIETRAALAAYKISARAESFVIEGVSIEGDLVPLITVDNVLTDNVSTNFLAIDFERNSPDVDPLFDLSVKLEALEVTYHHHAVLELISFFKLNDADVQTTILWTYRVYEYLEGKVLDLVEAIVSQTLRISFKIDIKAPYIIFPEHGSVQKGGYMLVVDLGKVSLHNQLQAPDVQLENATLMELDELLYDRVHVVFTGCQVLCCHSGDDWRMARKKKDSEFHVVPKIQTVATIAYSIKPEYRQLSRTKVSVSVTSLKFNLSETKLRLMMHFLNLLLVVYQRNIEKYESDFARCIAKKTWSARLVLTKELSEVQRCIYLPSITRVPGKVSQDTKDLLTCGVPKLDRSVGSSEISQEDLELLSKTISLSGFDDNVSPCNHINIMLRFVIGELSIHLACLNHGREEPYLNLRIGTLRLTTAIMQYGPAIQFDIGSILLVDKTNAGVTGSYLELISTDEPHEILRVSYRKVRSNCPDFKSHFKSIERQLVVNVLNVNLNLHRPALLNIRDYWQTMVGIFEGSPLFKFVGKVCRGIVQYTTRVEDPPIPPGAIKLKYYASLDTLVLRICDKDTDLLEIRVLGLESDCSYIANERMYLSAHLRHLQVEDLNEETLYSKILTTSGDKVFDLKYGRHTPKLLSNFLYPENVQSQDDVMTDGTFKFTMGRLNCVVLAKILHDLKHFFSPFSSTYCTQIREYLRKTISKGVQEFTRSTTKLHVFVTIDGFNFLLPQRKDVPTLIMFNTGQLRVENFFKKVEQPCQVQPNKTSADTNHLVINNILVELNNMTISRAIMMLTRDMEIQGTIVCPIRITFDIKRKIEYRSFSGISSSGIFNIQGTMEFVEINLCHRDLKAGILVWKDNLSKLMICKDSYEPEDTLANGVGSMKSAEDPMVKKLEDFLAHNETSVCEVNANLTLEGCQLYLFLDSEEVLSSPVRDLNHALCKLTLGEVVSSFAVYNDKSMKMKLSLQSYLLQDTRKESRLVKKIIQSPAIQMEMNSESCILVSRSPIVDISFTRSPGGERCVDALIQDIRINLSLPFVMHLIRYILDSLPGDQIDEGIINLAYESNHQATSRNLTSAERDKLKYARYFKEEPDASVSIRIRKPEILLFGEVNATNSQVVLLQGEVTIESSRHNCCSSIVCTLSDVHAKSKRQKNYLRQPPYWLLCPCDIEICRKEEGPDFNVNYTASVSKIDLHLSEGIIQTFIDIASQTTGFLDSLYVKSENRHYDPDLGVHVNLWTPKRISNVPYKNFEYNEADLFNIRGDKTVTINLNPVLVCILLEMEYFVERLPVIKVESTVAGTISDWYNNFDLESSIKVHAFCYNMYYKCWEPLIDLCTDDDIQYRPWELSVKMRHGEAFMVNSSWTDPRSHVKQDVCPTKKRSLKSFEQDSMDMVFITPEHLNLPKSNETQMFSKYEDDSDTDDEEGKKKSTWSAALLEDNSSEDEESESDDSSSNGDEVMEAILECNVDSFGPVGRESIKSNDLCTYITISSEEKLNFVITTNTITMVDMMLDAFVQTKSGIPIVPTSIEKLNLLNDIGHASRIELLAAETVNGTKINRLIAAQDYRMGSPPVTPPSSPEPEVHTAPTSPQLSEGASIDMGMSAYAQSTSGIAIVQASIKALDLHEPEKHSSAMASQMIENEIDFAEACANSQNHAVLVEEALVEDSSIDVYKMITGELLHVALEGFEDLYVCCPKRKSCNLVPLRPVRYETRYHLVIEATIDKHLHRTISVRSPLQFRNETSYALGLYYKKSLLDKMGLNCIGEPANPFDDSIRMAIIEPDTTYSIPMYIAYHFPIHILPTYLGEFRVSEAGIFWKELCTTNNTVKDIYCKSKSEKESAVFCVKVSCIERRSSTSSGCLLPNYLITIHPPLILNNQLPFVADVSIPAINYEVKIEPGERISMHSLSGDADIQFAIKIPNYLGSLWTGSVKLNRNLEKKFVQMSTDSGSDLATPFYLCVELCDHTSWQIVIRAQYWIINKSRLPLSLQVYDTLATYDVPTDEFLVFAQKSSKKKSMVRLRAHQSEWSQPFGLDGLTSASLVVCKDAERRRKYKVLTEIENSRLSPHFTKIIQFLPSFVIYNKTKRTLRIMEENDQADLWYYLSPGEDMSFWPVTESMKMRIKWKNSQLVSQHFDMTQPGKTVLRMDNGTAVCVEIEGGNNSPYYITFQKYTAGDIPVRIDNLCEDLFLKVSQSNLGQVALVNPFQSLLYTWDDPTKPRELIWNIYNNKKPGYKAQFEKDGSGHELVPLVIVERRDGTNTVTKSLVNARSWSEERHGSTSSDSNLYEEETKSGKLEHLQKDRTVVYWVSYMEGNQRVLLFAQHETVYLKAKSIIDPEPSRRELFLSLAGIGVSVVSAEMNKTPKELMNASLIDSAAHWELYLHKKWRSLSLEMSAWFESKYTSSAKRAQLDENFVDADLVKMQMTKPFFGKLRRTYSSAVWLHWRTSLTLTYLQGYVHRLQVDNQLGKVPFPVIMHSNVQKGLTDYAGNRKLKHCVEFASLKQRKRRHDVYKGICVIVRELNVNLQERFLLDLIDLIPKRAETKHSIAAKLRSDVSVVHGVSLNKLNSNGKRKDIVESLYISPILIRLKLLADTEGPNAYNISNVADYRNVVRFIFEYGEKGGFEKHAEFKFPFYQSDFMTIDNKQQVVDLARIYSAQAMQQFHVLVRSTTVLGSQYAYNFKSPGNHFYEPDTLLMYGDEIAEKLSHEIMCQLGYTTADTTQTTLLNFNHSEPNALQHKSKEPLYLNSDTPPMPASQSFFSTEIEIGMSSLLTTLTDSVHQEELKYFLKTLDKKTTLLFKTECPSSRANSQAVTDVIKRAQEVGHKFVSRVQLPRYVNPFKGVEVFSTHKARGMHLLSILNKSRCAEMETYWAHAALTSDGKHIALVSLQRLYRLEKGATWGSWNVRWSLETDQLLSPPTVAKNKLILHVSKDEKSSSNALDWYFESEATGTLEWLCRKINIAMILNLENSICSQKDL